MVVGRDLRADIRIPHPLVSQGARRARSDWTGWTAIDNGSLNGIYLHGRRVPRSTSPTARVLTLGNPDGPALEFEIGHHQGAAGRPLQTSTVVIPPRLPAARPPQPAQLSFRPAPSAVVPAAAVSRRMRH